jgi:hypothetical protein
MYKACIPAVCLGITRGRTSGHVCRPFRDRTGWRCVTNPPSSHPDSARNSRHSPNSTAHTTSASQCPAANQPSGMAAPAPARARPPGGRALHLAAERRRATVAATQWIVSCRVAAVTALSLQSGTRTRATAARIAAPTWSSWQSIIADRKWGAHTTRPPSRSCALSRM